MSDEETGYEYFGFTYPDSMERITVRVSPDLKQEIEEYLEEDVEHSNRSEVVRQALREYLG